MACFNNGNFNNGNRSCGSDFTDNSNISESVIYRTGYNCGFDSGFEAGFNAGYLSYCTKRGLAASDECCGS
jgi:hypothetical protein